MRCAPAIDQPTFIIRYTADACVFSQALDETFAAMGARDKASVAVRGTHHGQPLSAGEPSGREVREKPSATG